MEHKLTDQQSEVLATIKMVNNRIVLVNAKAGCGKTSTSLVVVDAIKPKKALYTAFNKAIVEAGKERFTSNVDTKTLHALAYQYVKPRLPIEDFTYNCIKENLGYPDKLEIINALDDFYRSDSVDMFEYFENVFEDSPKLIDIAIKYVEEMIYSVSLDDAKIIKGVDIVHLSNPSTVFGEGDIAGNVYLQKASTHRFANTVNAYQVMIDENDNYVWEKYTKAKPTFNFLLKYFHLCLVEGMNVDYDLVIFDEIQDSTGVALEIFKLLNSPKKLGLGDPDQAIYGFMNLVSGFDLLKDTIELDLNTSFRCSTEIAQKIELFGQQWLSKSFVFNGINNPKINGLTAYITATNAQIVFRINELHKEGKRYTLTREVKDIFAAPLALVTAAAGKPVLHKKYKFLETEYKKYTTSGYKSFFTFLKQEVNDDEIQSAVDLLMKFKLNNINIFTVLADAKASAPDPTITVGTFFSLKGLEYETVHIETDLNKSVGTIITKGGPVTQNEFTMFKGYYVACSRAQVNLINAVYLD